MKNPEAFRFTIMKKYPATKKILPQYGGSSGSCTLTFLYVMYGLMIYYYKCFFFMKNIIFQFIERIDINLSI